MQKEQTAGNTFSLTEGSILQKLLMVAVPIMGTQIVMMAYNLADMFWLGRYVGSDAVAASGTVGMYLWLSMAFVMYGRMGAEIGVSQNIGRGDPEAARAYGQASFTLAALLGLGFAAVMAYFRTPLIGFFNIQEAHVVAASESYLAIVSIGLPFNFIAAAVTGVFTGSGNSRLPFYINCVGLGLNMLWDWLFIAVFEWGVQGAAWATSAAQIVAGLLSMLALVRYGKRPFASFRLFAWPKWRTIRQILWWGTPIAIESFLFTFLSMIINRWVALWGAGAIAAQRVSTQVESLAWLIAGGFSSAVTAYVGQNFGAGKWGRIHKGFRLSSLAMAAWAIGATVLLYTQADTLIRLFIPDEPEVLALGVMCLKIIAVFQLPACLEGIAAGAFRGLGRTIPPSLVSVTSNAGRVIVAYAIGLDVLGLEGLWWVVSIGMGVRGAWMFVWYLIHSRKLPKEDQPQPQEISA